MKVIPTVLLAILLMTSSAVALERKPLTDVDINALVAETQRTKGGGENHLSLAWFVPVEYWVASLGSEASSEDNKNMLDLLKPYFLLGVVQTDISPMAAFKYYTSEEVASELAVTYTGPKGKSRKLRMVEKLDEDMDMLLKILKPVLSSAMGQLGDSFYFYVYSARDDKGVRLADPYERGELEVKLKKRSGEQVSTAFEFPLDNLYVPRLCPNGEPAHVSWKYCPWSGKKLGK